MDWTRSGTSEHAIQREQEISRRSLSLQNQCHSPRLLNMWEASRPLCRPLLSTAIMEFLC